MKFTFSFSLVFGLALLDSANGQIVQATTDVALNAATLLFKPVTTGIKIVSAILESGFEDQLGRYFKPASVFPGLTNVGIILASGPVDHVEPNNDSGHTYGTAPDEDLDKLLTGKYATTDSASLVMLIEVPAAVTVTWTFVFGSNDYNSGVAEFPDLFGFFVNGVNQAKIAGSAVSTSTVNCGTDGMSTGKNCDQLVLNDDQEYGQNEKFTSMNSYTKPQTMVVTLPAGTHSIKVAIADADTVFGANDDISAANDAFVLVGFKSAVVSAPVPVPVPQMMGMMMMGMMR
jgi:hypothetical protein